MTGRYDCLSLWLCVDVDSLLVDQTFINNISASVNQLKSPGCHMAEFRNIMSQYLSPTSCMQLFALYQQVFYLQLVL